MWILKENTFKSSNNRAYESLFTLGSGYMHIRGSLEEHLNNSPQNTNYNARTVWNISAEKKAIKKADWGTYVSGIYGRHPNLGKQLINLPFFIGLAAFIDGEKLDMEESSISSYERKLNLRNATLQRSFIWNTKSGIKVKLDFERFISAARPHICFQKMTIEPENDVEIEVESFLDADTRTNGYNHLIALDFSDKINNSILMECRTDNGNDLQILSQILDLNNQWDINIEGCKVKLRNKLKCLKNKTTVIEKRTFVATSNDLASYDIFSDEKNVRSCSYDQLHAEHAEIWNQRWESSDIEIEGDDSTDLSVRTNIYHLLRSHVPDDARVAIDAKGYSSSVYWGRFFWDTEMYMLPFFLYTDPSLAKTLVDFRVNNLESACKNAANYGYKGAKYPWESDNLGNECCPNWQYKDHQIHITADVIYGILHYVKATGNESYFTGPASKVMVEVARYLFERVDKREGDLNFSILGVTGPDEYKPLTNNNSYTNKMAALALETAVRYANTSDASQEEFACFEEISKKLPVTRRKDGLILQCENFDELAEPQFKKFWKDKNQHFAQFVSQERIYRSKCLKQPDVLMMMALFFEDFKLEEIKRAWDYYLPLTTHDSSLSKGVHALLAAKMRLKEEAWEFFIECSNLDIDIKKGNAGDGIHIANSGMVWQIIIFGFAGLTSAVYSDIIKFKPNMPEALSSIRFNLIWKKHPLNVTITKTSITIHNKHNSKNLSVMINNRISKICPKTISDFSLKQ